MYSLRDDALRAIEALPDLAGRAQELVWSQDGTGPATVVREAAQELQGNERAQGSASVNEWVQQAIGSVLALAGHVTVIVFLVFFLLLSGGHFRHRLVEIAGTRYDRRITASIIDDINAQIARFLLVRLVTAVVVALATWIVLAWMRVEQAAVWAILAGVFNSIPYFGPVVVSGAYCCWDSYSPAM